MSGHTLYTKTKQRSNFSFIRTHASMSSVHILQLITDVSTAEPPLALNVSAYILAITVLCTSLPARLRTLLTFWFVEPAIPILVKFLSDCKLASYLQHTSQ